MVRKGKKKAIYLPPTTLAITVPTPRLLGFDIFPTIPTIPHPLPIRDIDL